MSIRLSARYQRVATWSVISATFAPPPSAALNTRALARRTPLELDAVADVERRAIRAGVAPEVAVRAQEPNVGDAEVAVL